MRKRICLILAVLIAAVSAAGCGKKEEARPSRFEAANEIITYDKIDPNKTVITVSSLGNNANVKGIVDAFNAANPDIQAVRLDLTGGTNEYRPVLDMVKNGIVPDVMFMNENSFNALSDGIKYFENLSANEAVANFEAEALSRLAVNGHIYYLPSASEVNCMIYNKTLFERYNWPLPKTFDEFIALCLRIREETNGEVQPWNPNAKYDSVFTIAIEAFVYEQLFGGLENRTWYNDFINRKATFKGHMEPLYDVIQTLIDNKILLEEHFNYSATTRGKEFAAGKIAMLNVSISHMQSDKYEFGYMPYPTTKGEMGYVNDAFSSMMCVPKTERSEKEKEAVNRFVSFFATEEGQNAMIADGLMVSNVKDVSISHKPELSGIESVIAQGRKFSSLNFPAATERNWTFKDNAYDMVTGSKTVEEIISDIDAKPYKDPEEPAAAVKLCDVTENFSSLEFSCYIADAYREKAGADIGLINHGVAYRGNLVMLFKGPVMDTYMYPIKPRSFANGSTLVKVSMTGEQLLGALNHPQGNDAVSDSVYAFSGLKCIIAPNNELGKKYVSVKLADETDIDPKKLYTVAIWDGTVAEEFITEKLEAYEGTWEELMAEKFKNDKEIAPAKDGRFELKWE